MNQFVLVCTVTYCKYSYTQYVLEFANKAISSMYNGLLVRLCSAWIVIYKLKVPFFLDYFP